MKRTIGIAAAALLAAAVLCAPVTALSARCACVMDARTGAILFEKNASERSLIASTTKIMTGLLICEDCDLDREVCVPPAAVGIEGSSMYLQPGDRLRIRDLLCGMLLRSGNDCAAALAIVHSGSQEAFAEAMNDRARAMGLRDTHFANPHGLDDVQNYSTALDLARLAGAAMDNAAFAGVAGLKTARVGDQTAVNHNKLLWRYPGADGVKTGYTKAAGRILASSAVRQGRRLICVTIHDPDDWNDHCALLDEAFARFDDVLVCQAGRTLGMFPGGKAAVCPQDVRALLLPSERVDCVCIRIGRDRGSAAFLCGGAIVAQCPLTTGEANGRTDPEDHSSPPGHLPQEGGGTDP